MFLNSLNLLPLTNHNASWDLSHPDRAETARQHLQPCFCFKSEAFFLLWLFSRWCTCLSVSLGGACWSSAEWGSVWEAAAMVCYYFGCSAVTSSRPRLCVERTGLFTGKKEASRRSGWASAAGRPLTPPPTSSMVALRSVPEKEVSVAAIMKPWSNINSLCWQLTTEEIHREKALKQSSYCEKLVTNRIWSSHRSIK